MRYLGQHFLIQKNIVKKIVDVADLNKNDVVLEVGPGKGVLTEELLKRAKKVIAVEKDRRLCDFLGDKFSDEIKEGRLVLAEGDILKIFNPPVGGQFLISKQISNPKLQITNKSEILNSKFETNSKLRIKNFKQNQNQELKLPEKYKIVANIPYYITSRFLKIFLEEIEPCPQKMVLMLQKEVAERICGKPPKSILAVSVQVYGKPKIAFKVSAGNFFPPPKVDSAVLIIDNISKKWFNSITEKDFFAIVKSGFAKKRKFLINNLLGGLNISKTEIESVFKECGINFKARAEELKLEEWKCLTKNLKCKNQNEK